METLYSSLSFSPPSPPFPHLNRIPFATPGSMPYALPSMSNYSTSFLSEQPHKSEPSVTSLGGRNDEKTPFNEISSDLNNTSNVKGSSNLTPLGLMAGYSNFSDRKNRDKDDFEFNKSLLDFDAEMRVRSTRVALFEKSLGSPGMTPIPLNEVEIFLKSFFGVFIFVLFSFFLLHDIALFTIESK